MNGFASLSLYQRIYEVVRRVPEGKVITYGQVAKIVGSCSARNVGYAMAAVPHGLDIPWQRVINAKGEISKRADGDGALIQKEILLMEGVEFGEKGTINLADYGCYEELSETMLDME